MDRRLAVLPMLFLAGPSLSGCVAAAIPALAGAGLFGTQVDGETPGDETARALATNPNVTVARSGSEADPTAAAQQPRPTAPAASPQVAMRPPAPAATAGLPGSAQAAEPAPRIAAASPPPAPSAALAAAQPVSSAAPPGSLDAPSLPRPDAGGFARFVRYGRGTAAVSAQSTGPLSALLADPIALDGTRRRCAGGEQPVVIIDLDPAGGLFEPPADPERDVARALGLAVLREAGVQIVWFSDVPVSEIGAVRTAIEGAGLDPRGEDIVSLRRDPNDRKQARKESLASQACIIAIAGDEKPDFDERFRYLKNPEAGAPLETAIDDGWFLIEPIFPSGK